MWISFVYVCLGAIIQMYFDCTIKGKDHFLLLLRTLRKTLEKSKSTFVDLLIILHFYIFLIQQKLEVNISMPYVLKSQ